MSAHQALLPLGFSRQEHWSGLPFPSPMHESETVKVKSLSRVRLLATAWTAAHQVPLSMGFSRQEYWSGVPLPSPIQLSRSPQSTGFGFLASYSKFPLAVCFTYGSVYVSTLLFQFIPGSPSPAVSTHLFSMSVSPLLSCREIHQYHLSRFHIYALIYNICFSLPDLLQSV